MRESVYYHGNNTYGETVFPNSWLAVGRYCMNKALAIRTQQKAGLLSGHDPAHGPGCKCSIKLSPVKSGRVRRQFEIPRVGSDHSDQTQSARGDPTRANPGKKCGQNIAFPFGVVTI